MKPFSATLLTLLSIPLLSGCFSPVEDTEAALDDSEKTTLKVTTRAAVGDIVYPVHILAYDTDGQLKGEQTLTAETEKIKLQLPEGTYHISALSGVSSYQAPKDYNQSSRLIKVDNGGYADQPLMMGGADVVLGSTSASVSVVMTYRVASLNLSLADVPSDVTAVTVSVSQQYGAIDMLGALSSTATATIPCQKEGDTWLSKTVYLMPGTGTSTTLTLSLTAPSGQMSYSYVLGEALAAAVPYTLTGTYVASSAPYISGMLTVEGWQDERAISFDFGSGSTGGGGSNVTPDVEVNTLPEAGSAWNGHIVALVDNATSTGADLLLLSLQEYNNVYSPLASGHESEMSDLAQSYSEGNLSDWYVPTEEQARQLKSAYAGNYDDLNNVIEELSGSLITVSTANNNARYLCENGTKTFNFAANGSINNAGKTVKYRLRLVKKVHVSVE